MKEPKQKQIGTNTNKIFKFLGIMLHEKRCIGKHVNTGRIKEMGSCYYEVHVCDICGSIAHKLIKK